MILTCVMLYGLPIVDRDPRLPLNFRQLPFITRLPTQMLPLCAYASPTIEFIVTVVDPINILLFAQSFIPITLQTKPNETTLSKSRKLKWAKIVIPHR